jgi:hypothetical protein
MIRILLAQQALEITFDDLFIILAQQEGFL